MSFTSLTFLNSLRRVPARARKIELRPYEVAMILLLALAVLSLVVYYFITLSPLRDKIATDESKITENSAKIEQLRKGLSDEKKPDETAKQSLASLREFDGFLSPELSGRTAIISDINDLARKYQITITDALKFTKIEETQTAAAQGASHTDKVEIYPGVHMEVGVLGSYTNLRNFISDIEANKNFIVLNSIQLEGIEPQQLQRGGVRGGGVVRGPRNVGPIEVIALRLRLDAYFKR